MLTGRLRVESDTTEEMHRMCDRHEEAVRLDNRLMYGFKSSWTICMKQRNVLLCMTWNYLLADSPLTDPTLALTT